MKTWQSKSRVHKWFFFGTCYRYEVIFFLGGGEVVYWQQSIFSGVPCASVWVWPLLLFASKTSNATQNISNRGQGPPKISFCAISYQPFSFFFFFLHQNLAKLLSLATEIQLIDWRVSWASTKCRTRRPCCFCVMSHFKKFCRDKFFCRWFFFVCFFWCFIPHLWIFSLGHFSLTALHRLPLDWSDWSLHPLSPSSQLHFF